METPVTRSAVREALHSLVDYAGLFPPAKLPLPAAIDEYREARSGAFSWMLGRFIITLSALKDTAPALRDTPFCVIIDDDVAPAARDIARLREAGTHVEVIEVPPTAAFSNAGVAIGAMRDLHDALARNDLGDLPTYVELRRDERWHDLLAVALPELSRLGLRAKLRCGGVTADAFPTVDEVSSFLATAQAAAVPFKATAGLHHPVRHVDAGTGFPMHGFLNLLAGAALVPSVDGATLQEVIAEEDPAAFSLTPSSLDWRERAASAQTLAQTRSERFVSYGSCSFEEPVNDLIALGMLSR